MKREEIGLCFRQSSYETTELYLKRGYHCKPLHDINIGKITLTAVAAVREREEEERGDDVAAVPLTCRLSSPTPSAWAYARTTL